MLSYTLCLTSIINDFICRLEGFLKSLSGTFFQLFSFVQVAVLYIPVGIVGSKYRFLKYGKPSKVDRKLGYRYYNRFVDGWKGR